MDDPFATATAVLAEDPRVEAVYGFGSRIRVATGRRLFARNPDAVDRFARSRSS
jgi:hypothetical protein